jgi:hypothetical protein
MCLAFISCINKSQSEVSILGSVHFSTDSLNADSIYQVLLGFKPDIILTEIDEDKMYQDFTYKNLYNENEIISIIRYKINHPNVLIRPIEIFKRNEKRKEIGIFSEASEVFQNLNRLDNKGLFTTKEQLIWNRFADYWDIADEIGRSSLSVINSTDSDIVIDSLMNYQYLKLGEIINNNPIFEDRLIKDSHGDPISLKKYYELWADFEMRRNLAISENALSYIRDNPEKRIIISLGFKHRFYLKKFLGENGIKVTEFYE